MSEFYKCEYCGGLFQKSLSDNEALQVKEERYPDVPLDECIVVCDGCYQGKVAN